MATVYLALGSNMGNSLELIDAAVIRLKKQLNNVDIAPVYISKAVGYVDQPDFYNTALRGQTTLSPEELLKFVKTVEQELGRVYRFRWGPREIDIDIIYYDDLVMDTPRLTIPHPRAAERDFVLRPVSDIDPQLRDPRRKVTVTELMNSLPPEATAVYKRAYH